MHVSDNDINKIFVGSENIKSVQIPETNVEKSLKLDDFLRDELGEFGWFQLRNILLVAIPIMASAFKKCGETGKLYYYNPDWILNAIPETKSGLSSCNRYAPNEYGINGSWDSCPASLFDRGRTISCEKFVYTNTKSVAYDFDLGCQEWLRALAGTLSSIGVLLGLPLSGYISDRFGRRIALIFNIFNLGFIGIIKAFSVNYYMFMMLQLVQAMLGSSVYAAAYVIATELIGQKYRVVTSATSSSMFSIGQVLLGGVFWLIGYWRYATLALYIPCLFMVVYYWLLTESVRWLLTKKKYTEARRILESAARVNKKTINEKSMQALLNPPQTPALQETKSGLVRSVLRSPTLLRRVCTTPVWWISMTFVYYGLSINSTSLSDTTYLNYMLTCAVELPGYCAGVLLLDRIGRRATLCSGFFFSALCNILFVFIPRGMTAIRLIAYLLGKVGISMAVTSLYLYTSELYPTEFRHSLLAFSSMIGRLGSIAAPLTPVFAQYWHGLPSAMFGAMGVIGGALVLTQPETLGTKLPDTLAEAEMLGKLDPKLSSATTS